MGRWASSESSRQRLITAAATLFATKGYRETTVDAIAAEAGISRGSVFWHFRTKEGLLWAVTEQVFSSWASGVLLSDVGDATGLEAIGRAMASHRAVLEREREVFRLYHVLMADALGPRPEMAPTFVELHRHFRGLAGKWLGEAAAAGEVDREIDTEGMAIVLVGALSGIAGHWLMDPEGVDLDLAYGQLRRLVDQGLGGSPPWTAGHPPPPRGDPVAAPAPRALRAGDGSGGTGRPTPRGGHGGRE